MRVKISNIRAFIQKALYLARPFGRKKLGFLFLVILVQGFFQVLGVTSIFPFLALASNPASFRSSSVGEALLAKLPELSDQNLLMIAGLFALGMLLASNLLMLFGEVVRTSYVHSFGHWLRLRLMRRMLAAIVAGVFGVFYYTIFTFLKHRRRNKSNMLKMANRGAMKEAQQLLGGVKAIKVHGVEDAFLARYGHHSHLQSSLQKWFPIYQNSPRYLIEPLAFGGIVVLVLVLSAKGEDFTSLLPTLGVMALAGYRLIPNFQLLYGSATGMSLMMHSLEELYEEFTTTGAGREVSAFPLVEKGFDWREQVELKDISFTYEGTSQPVIDGLNLSIRKNHFVAFIGETGSGKSTIIDIILGLHTPQKGTITLDGRDLGPDEIRKWRAGIGYVPQEIFLLDDSIAANIAFGADPDKIDMDKVRQAAEVAQIRTFIETELEDGFDAQVGERGVRLSGGQRQRIGLARALYNSPSLLILDEATSALDNATEAALMEAIEGLYGQVTLIVIAHRLSTVRKADCIFQLNHGKVEREGTFEELGLSSS
jgi:ABC-type multidrug transport system fused ATPase/permease subunit